MLARYYEVELNTFVFSAGKNLQAVEKAAEQLGFIHHIRTFPEGVLIQAVDQVISDGYPNNAITMVHLEALTHLAGIYPVIADGTRFDDRVPYLHRDEVQRLTARFGISYVRPLLGYQKQEVLRLAEREVLITYGETGNMENGDYEGGIRDAIRQRGLEPGRFFPIRHEQSLVMGRTGTSGVQS
jgi:predicted subunit of tRNA(5-methylaminomethyl-2-thiouridylate) methyltransferase